MPSNPMQDALLCLLKRMPLRDITVAKIAAECDYTRNTFYYYTKDILSLLSDVMTQRANELIRTYPQPDELEKLLNSTVTLILDHRLQIRNIFNYDRRRLYPMLFDICHRIAEYYFTCLFYPEHFSDDIWLSLVRNTGNTLAAFLLDWVNKDLTNAARDEIPYLCTIIQAELTQLSVNSHVQDSGQ